jgi:hypothetical protein
LATLRAGGEERRGDESMLRAALTIAVVLALNLVACGDAEQPTQVTERENAGSEPTEALPPPEPPSAPAGVVDRLAPAEKESTGLDRVRRQLDAFGRSHWKALEQDYSAAGERVVWRITTYDLPPAREVDTAGYCVRIAGNRSTIHSSTPTSRKFESRLEGRPPRAAQAPGRRGQSSCVGGGAGPRVSSRSTPELADEPSRGSRGPWSRRLRGEALGILLRFSYA